MIELVQDNWLLFVVALVIGLLVAWWIFAASRRTKVEIEPKDEQDGAVARRNQALIDTPPAASGTVAAPPVTPVEAAGTSEALAAAVTTAPPPAGAETGEAVPGAVAAAPEVADADEAAPAISPAPPPTEQPGGDDLLRIKGLGPKLVDQLHGLGITSLAQIAAWDDAEIDRVDAQLGRFQGRIRRDDWPEQARLLTAGDHAAYEERFGRI